MTEILSKNRIKSFVESEKKMFQRLEKQKRIEKKRYPQKWTHFSFPSFATKTAYIDTLILCWIH